MTKKANGHNGQKFNGHGAQPERKFKMIIHKSGVKRGREIHYAYLQNAISRGAYFGLIGACSYEVKDKETGAILAQGTGEGNTFSFSYGPKGKSIIKQTAPTLFWPDYLRNI
jgi:hypothetical protein